MLEPKMVLVATVAALLWKQHLETCSKLLLTIELNTIITSALSSTMGCSSSGPFVLSCGDLQGGHIRLLFGEAHLEVKDCLFNDEN